MRPRADECQHEMNEPAELHRALHLHQSLLACELITVENASQFQSRTIRGNFVLNSFKGAMMGTTDAESRNKEAMAFKTAFVRSILVWFECQCGNDIFCPELSNLTRWERRMSRCKCQDRMEPHPFWEPKCKTHTYWRRSNHQVQGSEPGAPWRSTRTLIPCFSAHVTAFIRYGSWPEMKGSPGPTSKAQYPMGIRTWFRLQMNEVNTIKKHKNTKYTHPAAAIATKSLSVIQVSQCFRRVRVAFSLSCRWPKVHSSTMLLSPVESNKLGVIQG